MTPPPKDQPTRSDDPDWVRFVDMTYLPADIGSMDMAPRLPIVVTPLTVNRPIHAVVPIKLDTGFGGELLLSRTLLEREFRLQIHRSRSELGRIPLPNALIPNGRSSSLRTSYGESRSFDLYQAKLWLGSNRREFMGRFVQLPLAEGVAVDTEPTNSGRRGVFAHLRAIARSRSKPLDQTVGLIGRRLFLHKNLRLELQYPPRNTDPSQATPRILVFVRSTAISPN